MNESIYTTKKIPVKFNFNKEDDIELTIYTLKGCGACEYAKKILQDSNILYKIKDIKENKEYVEKYSNGYKYAPAVFLKGDKFLGGTPELEQYIKSR